MTKDGAFRRVYFLFYFFFIFVFFLEPRLIAWPQIRRLLSETDIQSFIFTARRLLKKYLGEDSDDIREFSGQMVCSGRFSVYVHITCGEFAG